MLNMYVWCTFRITLNHKYISSTVMLLRMVLFQMFLFFFKCFGSLLHIKLVMFFIIQITSKHTNEWVHININISTTHHSNDHKTLEMYRQHAIHRSFITLFYFFINVWISLNIVFDCIVDHYQYDEVCV